MRAEFGWDWLARWYVLLEMVAAKMDETDRCDLEYPVGEWCRRFECRPQKFRSWALRTVQLTATQVVENGELIRISIPNLLKKRDNFTRHLQATSKRLANRLDVDVDTEKEKKKRAAAHTKELVPDKPDIPDQIIAIMYDIADRLKIPAYRTAVTPDLWRPELLDWGKEKGFSAMLDEARKFKQWFIGRVEAKKEPLNKGHYPRLRFLKNWLGRVESGNWRPGDNEWGEFPEAVGPSPREEVLARLAEEDARPVDPALVKSGERLLEGLSGIPAGARGGCRRINGEKP
jgi:hypothetical protein